jgi:haloalkane dehalogenase
METRTNRVNIKLADLPVIELARSGKYVDVPTDEAIQTYLAPLVSSPQRKALTNAYAVALAPNPPAGIESALKSCHVATRIVWGLADKIFSQASPDYLARILGKSLGVRRVAGAKLFFPEEMPDLIAEEAEWLWDLAR